MFAQMGQNNVHTTSHTLDTIYDFFMDVELFQYRLQFIFYLYTFNFHGDVSTESHGFIIIIVCTVNKI